jgi:4-hydroxybenzoate polyprenyltransferase
MDKMIYGRRLSSVLRLPGFFHLFYDEFVNGGHLLGINSAFIALATMMIFNLSFRWDILVMLYFLTMIIYGFDHIYDIKHDSLNTRVEYINRNKRLYSIKIALFCVFFLIMLFSYGTMFSILLGLCILFLGISYTLWFKALTKKIIGFKTFYVASTLALAILFTATFFHTVFPVEIVFFTCYTATSCFMNCSLCDIKDMETDKKHGLKTLPLVLGKQRFFFFITGINTVSLIISTLLVTLQVIPFYFISLLGFNMFWYLIILKGMKPDIDYHWFTTRIMDSMEIISFLILFTGKTLITGNIL